MRAEELEDEGNEGSFIGASGRQENRKKDT